MSLITTLPTPRLRSRRPPVWREDDAIALAVADVTSIRLHPDTVRTVVTDTRARYGGQAGIEAELSRRLAGAPGQAAQAERTLRWARRVLSHVHPTPHGGQA